MHNSQCTITYPKQKMTHKIYEDAIFHYHFNCLIFRHYVKNLDKMEDEFACC